MSTIFAEIAQNMRESEYKSVVVENIVERFQLIYIVGRRDDGIGGIFGVYFALFQKQSENAHNFQKNHKNAEKLIIF